MIIKYIKKNTNNKWVMLDEKDGEPFVVASTKEKIIKIAKSTGVDRVIFSDADGWSELIVLAHTTNQENVNSKKSINKNSSSRRMMASKINIVSPHSRFITKNSDSKMKSIFKSKTIHTNGLTYGAGDSPNDKKKLKKTKAIKDVKEKKFKTYHNPIIGQSNKTSSASSISNKNSIYTEGLSQTSSWKIRKINKKNINKNKKWEHLPKKYTTGLSYGSGGFKNKVRKKTRWDIQNTPLQNRFSSYYSKNKNNELTKKLIILKESDNSKIKEKNIFKIFWRSKLSPWNLFFFLLLSSIMIISAVFLVSYFLLPSFI